MGRLIDGVWQTEQQVLAAERDSGEFVRGDTTFRSWVTADGSSGFEAEPGRYHLYVSHACPWANRTMIARSLKGLNDAITVSVVDPLMFDQGWPFSDDLPDHLFGSQYLYEVYTRADATYTGRVTVPVLWDKQTGTIVNNESSEIIRMFDGAFAAWADDAFHLYPEALRGEIDEINAIVYPNVNNGVYRCGFARTQAAYDRAANDLFSTLDLLEGRLSERRYLAGDQLTEADIRLFTTLIRFDHVYHGHFKCNRRRIVDYPALWGFTRDIYQTPGVAQTVHMRHIREHYHRSHTSINPYGIVPIGPVLDFDAPHDRQRLG